MAKKSASEPYRLRTNNRFWVLCLSGTLAGLVLMWVFALVPAGELRIIRTQQAFGFFSIIYLYLAVLATPLSKAFPKLPFIDEYLHVRRGLGVSAFFFGLLHSAVTFFGQLGGPSGLAFLSGEYRLALILGAAGLGVLAAMALTSFDKVIDRMGFPRWKRLHQLVYFAGIAILVHVFMLGTHYAYGGSSVARLTLLLMLILLVLELLRIQQKLNKKFPVLARYESAGALVLCGIFLSLGFILGQQNAKLPNLAVHGDTHSSGTSEHGDQYTGFDPVQEVNGQTLRISQKQISREALINGSQIVQFTASPEFKNLTASSCFLVNQQNFTYIQGFTKNFPDRIDCLPIGDVNPPQAGPYTLYLRTTTGIESTTTPFSLEITP